VKNKEGGSPCGGIVEPKLQSVVGLLFF